MKNILELEIELTGRVQGIMFRALIKKFCDNLGLVGFVSNFPDGSVKIIVQGDKIDLDNFVSWLQKNPGISKINSMNLSWNKVIQKFSDFKIIKSDSFIADKGKSLILLGKGFLGIKPDIIPKHVAIIPDGNRRWAKEKGLVASSGHYRAADMSHVMDLFKSSKHLGIKYFSIWGFSTENWKRDKSERDALFDILIKGVNKFEEVGNKEGIRFRFIGRRDRLPKKLISALETLENKTKDNRLLFVQLCLDYGGRDEIIRAVNKIIKSKASKISEEEFEGFLDSAGIPDPDLVIRTSGEMRTSGFMPYQAAYSELYFCEKYFPDFGAKELKLAVQEFSRRARRFGK